jgi:hypothetical protein
MVKLSILHWSPNRTITTFFLLVFKHHVCLKVLKMLNLKIHYVSNDYASFAFMNKKKGKKLPSCWFQNTGLLTIYGRSTFRHLVILKNFKTKIKRGITVQRKESSNTKPSPKTYQHEPQRSQLSITDCIDALSGDRSVNYEVCRQFLSSYYAMCT